ncbi:MAG: hypothetical protein A2142_01945 [candidate division Zixibacteria bacterium RBG_16_48_11]|nr:MAG: hypothetical protein A2142_01945 [candidate division Zixibacteria bacterium RBG_16_48_11]
MLRKLVWGVMLWMGATVSAFSEPVSFQLEFSKQPNFLSEFGGKKVISRPKIGLALSGGGARGFAQIGILKVLERENIPIACIAGTSMGGIIGGLFAAGYTASEIEDLALNLNWEDVFSDTPSRLTLLQPQREEAEGALFQIRWVGLKPQLPTGLTSAQKLTNLFNNLTYQADYFCGLNFDRLPIPFRSVTTDLISGERVVLDSAELSLALRATMAVPLAITPVAHKGKLLVDGGLVDPVPVEVVRNMGADLVIAVNTSAELLEQEKIRDPLDIASQTVSIMSLQSKRESLRDADLVIEPDIKGFSSTDFRSADSLISLGEKAVNSLLPKVEKMLKADESQTKYKIQKLEFSGNENVSRESLLVWYGMIAPGVFSSQQIYQGLGSIYQSGYFQKVSADLDIDQGPGILSIILEENPVVREILIQNQNGEGKILASIAWDNPHPQVLNSRDISEMLEIRLRVLRAQGAELASLNPASYDPQSQRLVVFLDEGRISQINITGNQKTNDWVVKSYFPLRQGDRFEAEKAQKGLINLQNCGYFESVTLSVVGSPSGPILNLMLTEKSFYLLRGGLHYWDEFGLEGFAEGGYTNLFGAGQQIYLGASHGDRREHYSLRMKADRVFRTYLTYNLSLYYKTENNRIYSRHEEIGEADEIRRGAGFGLGHNLARLGKVWVEVLAERITLDNHVTQTSLSEDKRSLNFRLLFDNLDRYPYPTSGNFNRVNFEIASTILGGETSYRKFFISLETYVPLSRILNFHPGFKFGYADRGLPYYDKFGLGGKENFYGYYLEEERGDKLWQVGLEFRLKSAKRVFWFVRYDLGDIWDSQISIRELKQGLGLKLGISTPLGPIELAYGKNSAGFDRAYFTLGYNF